MTEAEDLMTQDEAKTALLAYMFSGALGSAKGKGVAYALVNETPSAFSYSTALEDWNASPAPVDRYLVKIDRKTRKVITDPAPQLIAISEAELHEAVRGAIARGDDSCFLDGWERFTDGALSVSYKIKVKRATIQKESQSQSLERLGDEAQYTCYVVQLRHHGNVASMDAFMTLVATTINPEILPVPTVFSIPGERNRQAITGMGRQVTGFVEGVMASSVYPALPHEDKLVFVSRMARAFEACWNIQLPLDQKNNRLIGELIAEEYGGRIALRCSLALEKQEEIEEFKEKYLVRIRDFVGTRTDDRLKAKIPAIVEDIPVVAMHADLGPHNVIVSGQNYTQIQAVIDWEFTASAPYASQHRLIEMLFRDYAPNGFGKEHERADELREAFWDAIPKWKRQNESPATKVFLEWFRFGLFMKPEARPSGLSEDEKTEYWAENIRVVEGVLEKYA
ncbi:hypothetical protein F5Y17DRAFT_473489 [Xylariaceae sp. FL0594]|nr:hypothetical protein F5Y17DRAFT_473489 [Xylariaceae sp. FL0594]